MTTDGRRWTITQILNLTSKHKTQRFSILDRHYTYELTQTLPNLTALLILSNHSAALKISLTRTRRTHLALTLTLISLPTGIATMASLITTLMRPSHLLLPSLPCPSRCHRQVEPPPHQRHHHRPEETPRHEKVPLPKQPNQLSDAPPMERRATPRSELVVDVDRCCRNSGSKQVRLESCEPVFDASSSRRPVTRASHAPVASHRMPGFGKFLVPALISRILGIS